MLNYTAADVVACREHKYVHLLHSVNELIYTEMILGDSNSIKIDLSHYSDSCKESIFSSLYSRGFAVKKLNILGEENSGFELLQFGI